MSTNQKVVLILVDGMRPDALCGIPEAEALKETAAYTLNARTVSPSVTLPCHMSLFHSVTPDRHGILSNTYAPQVRPIEGLCEVLRHNEKRCAFYYCWEELRDLARPGSLSNAFFSSMYTYGLDEATNDVADAAIRDFRVSIPDFSFIYLGNTDEWGHKSGWMSERYLESVRLCWRRIAQIRDTLDEDTTLIITADHGGHDRCHGTELDEDMTIPVFIEGKGFAPGELAQPVSILDLAPTVTAQLGVKPCRDWEGKSLI